MQRAHMSDCDIPRRTCCSKTSLVVEKVVHCVIHLCKQLLAVFVKNFVRTGPVIHDDDGMFNYLEIFG